MLTTENYRPLFICLMFVLGAAIGSFLCCEARRLRLKSKGQKSPGPRSVCLHCHKKLRWYENLPLVSWLIQRGKCTKCHQKIGLAEFLSELATATTFAIFSLNADLSAPLFVATFILAIILVSSLIFLAIYDGLYGELPVPILTFSIICAIILVIGHLVPFFASAEFPINPILETLGSTAILGGTYLLLYLFSRGKLVGSGDWLLGTAIGLALMSPWHALLVLFLSNLLATIVMLPQPKLRPDHKIYFGPFLVAAFIIVYAFAKYVIIKI